MEALIGQTGLTLGRICADVLASQGVEITPHKLLQRGDKVERNMEVGTRLMDRVEKVYLELVKRAA
jgi:hypothetical protein